MSRSDQDRIAELERTVADLQRRLNDVPCRPAQPPVQRNGWWLAELTETLLPQPNPFESPREVDAEILQWNGTQFVGSGQLVKVRDFWQTEETLPAGTRVEVAWYRNVWVYRRSGAGDTFVVFELAEDLLIKSGGEGENGELPGQALAYICQLTEGDYEPTEEQVLVVDPTPPDGYGLWSGRVGYQGLARTRNEPPANGQLPKFDIVWMERPAMFLYFEVLEDRDPESPEIHVTPVEVGFPSHGSGFQQGDRDQPLDAAESESGQDFIPVSDPLGWFKRALKGGKGPGRLERSGGRLSGRVLRAAGAGHRRHGQHGDGHRLFRDRRPRAARQRDGRLAQPLQLAARSAARPGLEHAGPPRQKRRQPAAGLGRQFRGVDHLRRPAARREGRHRFSPQRRQDPVAGENAELRPGILRRRDQLVAVDRFLRRGRVRVKS
jgi:hypothetical protein